MKWKLREEETTLENKKKRKKEEMYKTKREMDAIKKTNFNLMKFNFRYHRIHKCEITDKRYHKLT